MQKNKNLPHDFRWRILPENWSSPSFLHLYVYYIIIFSLPPAIYSFFLEFPIAVHLTIKRKPRKFSLTSDSRASRNSLQNRCILQSYLLPRSVNALPRLDFPIDDTKFFLTPSRNNISRISRQHIAPRASFDITIHVPFYSARCVHREMLFISTLWQNYRIGSIITLSSTIAMKVREG